MRSKHLLAVIALTVAGMSAISPATGASEPVFPKGGISFGVSGGVAIVQMDQINQFLQFRNLQEGTRFDEFSTGRDIEIDVRYAVTSKLFFGLQGGRIWVTAEDPISGERLEASGNPLILIAGTSTRPDAGIVFRFVGGIGAMLNGQLKNNLGVELNGTGFMGQLGGELEFRAAPAIGLSLQGVARTAQVTDPVDAQTGGTGFNIDLSGASILLGIRGYFGGGQGE